MATVLQIPELLDVILRFAGPEVQVSAWNVSRTWRRSSKSVISSSNKHAYQQVYPSKYLVNYGALISATDEAKCDLSQDELDKFDQAATRLAQRVESGYTIFILITLPVRLQEKLSYFPA